LFAGICFKLTPDKVLPVPWSCHKGIDMATQLNVWRLVYIVHVEKRMEQGCHSKPGDGYIVSVTSVAPVNYIIVGSHNPSLTYPLDSPGTNGSASGTQLWSYPFHGLAAVAGDVIAEINTQGGGSVVASVSRYVRTSDSLESYTGFSGVDFAMTPGEAYVISMTGDVAAYIPAHY
jgi:hypothetical protein